MSFPFLFLRSTVSGPVSHCFPSRKIDVNHLALAAPLCIHSHNCVQADLAMARRISRETIYRLMNASQRGGCPCHRCSPPKNVAGLLGGLRKFAAPADHNKDYAFEECTIFLPCICFFLSFGRIDRSQLRICDLAKG